MTFCHFYHGIFSIVNTVILNNKTDEFKAEMPIDFFMHFWYHIIVPIVINPTEDSQIFLCRFPRVF